MAYERRRQPLAVRDVFYARVLRSIALAVVLLGGALAIGVVGYHALCGFGWLDSMLNASMILGGMGPVDPIRTPAGKWFASIYAIFSGVVFLTSVGVMVAPVVHRALHRFHLEGDGDA